MAGHPTYQVNVITLKMRDYMDRRATTPKRVTPPTWGPPPPCKKALNAYAPISEKKSVQNNKKSNESEFVTFEEEIRFHSLYLAFLRP